MGIIEVFGSHDIAPWLKALSAVEIAALALLDSHWIKLRTNNPLERVRGFSRTSGVQPLTARDPAPNPRRGSLSRREILPQPGRGQVEAHRRHPMVDPEIHEHDPAIRGPNQRSRRRVTKCVMEWMPLPAAP